MEITDGKDILITYKKVPLLSPKRVFAFEVT